MEPTTLRLTRADFYLLCTSIVLFLHHHLLDQSFEICTVTHRSVSTLSLYYLNCFYANSQILIWLYIHLYGCFDGLRCLLLVSVFFCFL